MLRTTLGKGAVCRRRWREGRPGLHGARRERGPPFGTAAPSIGRCPACFSCGRRRFDELGLEEGERGGGSLDCVPVGISNLISERRCRRPPLRSNNRIPLTAQRRERCRVDRRLRRERWPRHRVARPSRARNAPCFVGAGRFAEPTLARWMAGASEIYRGFIRGTFFSAVVPFSK